MNMNEKRCAIVLGAVKGIGKAIAIDLLKSGIRVSATWNDWEDSLTAMKDDFSRVGTDHMIIKADLRDPAQVSSFIDDTISKFGRIDILINNIERGGMPVVHGPYTSEQWDLEMETTLKAKRWVFDKAFPHLKASGNGVVINFSSIAAITGRTGPASLIFNEGYSAANRGVALLTETWARMGAPEVRVNEIMLGLFETRHAEGTRGWGLLSDAQKKRLIDHTLLGRTGKISDLITAVRFLINDAPYMTGSILRLDGGYVLGGEKVEEMPPGVL